MKNHLVSGSHCNTIYIYNPSKTLQGMTNKVGLTFSIGDTKYHIFCTFSMCTWLDLIPLDYWISYIDSGLSYY